MHQIPAGTPALDQVYDFTVRRVVDNGQANPTCDYGDQPADYYERDSGSESPICDTHAREHYGSTWRQMVGRIGPAWFKRHKED